MKSKHIVVALRTALATTLLLISASPALAADSLKTAFTEGDWGLNFRWRFEDVNQDPFNKDATGIPLRARLNFTTADLNGFSFKIEYDYIFGFCIDTYNQGGGNTPGNGDFPVIADPDGGDLNQLYLQYKKGGGLFKAGRQRIIYDNARFVGNVGWRQNEQTFDAIYFDYKTNNGLDIRYAYVANVNRIFGNDVPAGDHDNNTSLLNLSYNFTDIGKLTGYYYDIDDKDDAAFSNISWGLRYIGTYQSNGAKFGYALEFASQRDAANNPVSYHANYWRADLSVGFKPATVYAGYESLGGDDSKAGQAFRTPLATLHAFNGWADKFLKTPEAGLNDAFIGVKGKLGKWNWNVVYHDFSAQSGSADFGTEWDASIARKLNQHYSVLFKAASFDTESPAYGDTTKIWVQFTADFKL